MNDKVESGKEEMAEELLRKLLGGGVSHKQIDGRQLYTTLLVDTIGAISGVMLDNGLPFPVLMDCMTTALAMQQASALISLVKSGRTQIEEAIPMLERAGEPYAKCALHYFFTFCEELEIEIPEELRAKKPQPDKDVN